MHRLQDIKPKTLSETHNAYLCDKSCLLDFGTSKVLLNQGLTVSYQNSSINIKDLFNFELENAVANTSGSPINNYNISSLNWNTLPINLIDANVFNAVASAGDAKFWDGSFTISNKEIQVEGVGFMFFTKHNMPKMIKWIDPECSLRFNLDHNAFYYIYQLFKGVTKTKPGVMKIAVNDNYAFITSEEEPYIIIIPRQHKEFTEKAKSYYAIRKFFIELEINNMKTIDRKSYVKDKDSIFKHLLKAVGDSPKTGSSLYTDLYESENTKLWILQKKS